MSSIIPKQKHVVGQVINQDENPLRDYMNPISKITLEALPRIYGFRKKKKNMYEKLDFQVKEKEVAISNRDNMIHKRHTSQDQMITHKKEIDGITIENQPEIKRFKTQMKSYDKKSMELLSRPREDFCSKRYCFCSKQHSQRKQKSQNKVKSKQKLPSRHSIKLPQLQNTVDPDQLQTKHKVVRTSSYRQKASGQRSPYTLLDLLRSNQKNSDMYKNKGAFNICEQEQQQQSERQINSKSKQINKIGRQVNRTAKCHNISVQTEVFQRSPSPKLQGKTEPIQYKRNEYIIEPKSTISADKQQQRYKQNILIRDSQKQSGQQKCDTQSIMQMDDNARLRLIKLRAQQKEKLEIDSESDDSKSVYSSISSGSLSKHVFKQDRQNTMFHTLKNKQTSSVRSSKEKGQQSKQARLKKEKFLFQKKNGLYTIPEEDEYITYLKEYEPLNQKFAIKNLVRKQNFKVVQSNEGVYFGEILNEKRHGKGIMVTDRIVYEGRYLNDVKTYGCQKNIDGVYKGQFANGKREGYGTFQWQNGQVFEGEWKSGTKNGFGIWKSPRGDFYEGNWILNRQNGKGTFKHRLSTYRGQFTDFLKQGEGEQIFVNGDKYHGTYKQGKPDGKGKYEWADGGYYEGDFVSGVRQGNGRWVNSNGTVYEGQFKNDFKDGYGIQRYTSGEVYEGMFRLGNKYEGKLYDVNKKVINITHQE